MHDGRGCLGLGMKAEKFSVVEGPGKHPHSSSPCCLYDIEKYYLHHNNVFVVYEFPLSQKGWMQKIVGFASGGLSDGCQETGWGKLGDSAIGP